MVLRMVKRCGLFFGFQKPLCHVLYYKKSPEQLEDAAWGSSERRWNP